MSNLDELKQKLSRETAQTKISPTLEAALLREFDQVAVAHASACRVEFTRRIALAAAIAALVLAVFWPSQKPADQPQRKVVEAARQTQPVLAVHPVPAVHKRKPKHPAPPDPEPQFVRIPYSLPLAPYERAEIVRMEMPVSALAAAGIHISTPDTSARAQADLVVGEDGMARAVRVISILNNE